MANLCVRRKSAQLEKAFIAAGAQYIEVDTLLDAATLLDLYGENIRARAYTTYDPLCGECILRPDFTVPIVQQHLKNNGTACYTYNGLVWRKQNTKAVILNTTNTFVQVGYELLGSHRQMNDAETDAEIFALFQRILPKNVTIITGDISILRAAIEGLSTSLFRRRALLRHLWRPMRFWQLLKRFATPPAAIKSLKSFINTSDNTKHMPSISMVGKFIGIRSAAEIQSRLNELKKDAQMPPLLAKEVKALKTICAMKIPLSQVLPKLYEISHQIPYLLPTIKQFEARIRALSKQGIILEKILFEGSYALTSMEYYDGFLFSFSHDNRVIASGGRYDSLTGMLGCKPAITAIGGVIRPDVLIGE